MTSMDPPSLIIPKDFIEHCVYAPRIIQQSYKYSINAPIFMFSDNKTPYSDFNMDGNDSVDLLSHQQSTPYLTKALAVIYNNI